MNKKIWRDYSFAIICIILGGGAAIYCIPDHENTSQKKVSSLRPDENRLIGLYHIDSIVHLFEKLDYPVDKDKIIKFEKTGNALIVSAAKKEEADKFFALFLHNSPVDSLNKVFNPDEFSVNAGNFTIKFSRRVARDTFIYVPHFIIADALCH